MGEFVHFKGRDAIIDAFDSNAMPAFALVSGKDILCQYTGDDLDHASQLLAEWIDRLKVGLSQGIYQVRCYAHPPEYVSMKTDFNFSFKCRLLDDNENYDATAVKQNGIAIDKRLAAIEARLSEPDELDEEEDEPVPPWQQAIIGALQRPDVQNFVMGKIFSVVDKLFGGPTMTQQAPHAMNGVPEEAVPPQPDQQTATAEQLYQALPAEERALLDQAMGILLAGDQQVGTNLYKVAMVLKTNPGKYRAFAAML